MKKLILILFISTLWTSCKKDEVITNKQDYFIFGRITDFCTTDCAQLYIIENGQIFPDSMLVPTPYLLFTTVPLSTTKYNLALPIVTNFPNYLVSHPDTTLGCPQCLDQGMIYIERSVNGVKTVWRVDPLINNIPVQVQPYFQDVLNIMGQL